jgi:hypothetical protein
MAEQHAFAPGTEVRVIKGAFAGRVGVVLDPTKALDPLGNQLPSPHEGCHWVTLTLNDLPFPAHLSNDEIEPISAEP